MLKPHSTCSYLYVSKRKLFDPTLPQLRLTGAPWAAGPVTPAAQTSSAAVGGAGGLRPPWHSCSAAKGGSAGLLHTGSADSAQSGPASAGCLPPLAAGPAHAEEREGRRMVK